MTDRAEVSLVPLTAPQMRALGADRAGVAAALGLDLPDDLRASPWWTGRADHLERDPGDTWSAVRLVLRHGVVVGNAGFHGPPDADGMVEAGYEVYPPYRRQGIARAVLEALLDQARAAAGVRTFRLSIGPGNAASLALARAAGFVRTGEQLDEVDGMELLFELPVDGDVS